MKCQSIFSEKNLEKNHLLSGYFAQRVVKVNESFMEKFIKLGG